MKTKETMKWMTPTKQFLESGDSGGKNNKATSRLVYPHWSRPLPPRIHSTITKMYFIRLCRLCHARNTRGGMWNSLRSKINGC